MRPFAYLKAKFGIYTHWGPVTVGCEDSPRGGQWYGKEMYEPGNPVFAYHKEKYGDQRTVGYKDMIPKFTADKFDPEKWADLFAKAGAKFAGRRPIVRLAMHEAIGRVIMGGALPAVFRCKDLGRKRTNRAGDKLDR